MRALSALAPFLALLLCAVLLAPAAAAATAGAAVPAGAVVLAGATILGAGIAVQLTAKKVDDKGIETTEGFRLDSESDTYAVDLQRFSEAKVEEGAGRVRVELAAAETARDDFRAIAVDEILRVQQLSHTGDDEFDADEERAYLESLPAKTLKLHFKKAREKTLSLKQQTSGEEPGDQTEDAAFGHVTVK